MPDDLDARLPTALDYKSRDRDVRNMTRLTIMHGLADVLETDPGEEGERRHGLAAELTMWIARLERKLKEG